MANLLLIAKYLEIPLEILTGETSNHETDKYFDDAKKMYFRLLEKYPPDTDSGKALRYFDNDLRDAIIRNGVQVAASAPFYTEKPFDLGKSGFLYTHIEAAFIRFYQDSVKTNQNLIDKVNDSLLDSDSLFSYRELDDEIQIPVKLKELGIDITVIANTYIASVDHNLIEELIEILEATKEKVTALKEKYPDTPERKAHSFVAISNEEKHPMWQWMDGEELRDEIDMPVEVKDSIREEISKHIDKI